MAGPLTFKEAQALRKRLVSNVRDEEALVALEHGLDTDAWWEAFDVAAISEADIEAIVTFALLDHLALALRGLWEVESELPDGHRAHAMLTLASTKHCARAQRAIKNIISSMREHARESGESSNEQ